MINQAVKRIINCVTYKSVIFIIHVAEWEKWKNGILLVRSCIK